MDKKPINILVIEDSEDDYFLIVRQINKSEEFSLNSKRVDSLDSMKKSLEDNQWDLIISDFSLPQFNTFRAIELLHYMQLSHPLIVVSGSIGEEKAVDLMRRGAKDFVLKNNLTRLIPIIKREYVEIELRKQQKIEIEKRIEAENALTQSEKKYEQIVKTSQEGIWILDNDLKTIFINSRVPKMLGYSYEKIYNSSIYDFVDPNLSYFLKNNTFREDIKFICNDNSEMWGIVSSSNICDESNKQIATLFMINDVTERKKAEIKLKKSYDEMEQKVNLRTEELKKSNRELELFAHVASHDLQAPLRTITGFTKLLIKKAKNKLDEKELEYLKFIEDGSEKMKILIEDLLEYSKINSSQIVYEEFDIKDMLNELLINLNAIIRESEAKIVFKDLPVIKAKQIQVYQLFQNLISNALKFKKDKNILIEISYVEDKDNYIFKISDNGIGIDSENLERIFLVFQRLHTIEEYPGTGIGLAICKKILERHNGNIWVESEVNKGSDFYFSIPKNL